MNQTFPWEQVSELLDSAMELPPPDRLRFLEQSCSDESLRCYVEAFSIMRFRAERQILAGLEHPHIARMLDGGSTEEGTPYLVMELIEGNPLDEYCDAQKLPIPERLRLFQQVCSAVQYAHQHLVIHRDLKPKNILVTKNGDVKLLDFGIAKILDPESFPQVVEPTSPLMRMLSPEYASPEQVLGGPVTTASDIYSLGIVLYLLLTGQRPYSIGSGSFAELHNAICETEPVRPSEAVRRSVEIPGADGQSRTLTPGTASAMRSTTAGKLAQRIRGDLDNIVLKTLCKEPQRRYDTVAQLSDDLRRHLEGLPIKARPVSLLYRTQKFIQRHMALAATIGVALATVLLAFAFSLREAHVARQQRDAAERRLRAVRDLALTNLVEVHSAMEHLPGAATARNIAIQRSLQYLDQLNAEVQNDLQLTREVGDAYEKIGDIQGAFSGADIGDSHAAQVSFGKALELRTKVLELPGSTDEDRLARLDVLRKFTRCLMLNGDTAAAYDTAQSAMAGAMDYAGKHPGTPAARTVLATAHFWLAAVSGGVGSSGSTRQIEEAIEHDRTHANMFEELALSGTVAENMIWRSQLLLALHLSKARKFEESQRILEHAIAVNETRPGENQSGLSDFYNTLGLICERQGMQQKALELYMKAWPIARAAAAADPQDLDAQLGLQIAEAHLGMQTVRLERQRDGLKRLNEAVSRVEKLLQADPGHAFYMALLVVGYAYQGEVLSAMGDQNGAVTKYQKALSTAELISHHDPADLESRLSIAKVHAALGVVQSRSLRYTEARREFTSAKSGFDLLLRARPQDAEAAYYTSQADAYTEFIAACRDRLACTAAERMRLPSLLN